MRPLLLLSLLFSCLWGQTQDSLVHQFSDKHKQNWVVPALIAGYAGADYLCYRYLDTRIQKGVQANKNGTEDFIFNTVSDLGLGRTQTIGILTVGAASLIFKNTRLKKTVLIWAGSLFINSIATDQLKTTFQRHRPNTGDPYNTFDWRKGPNLNRSFPSGHTTNAFTTATVWVMQYRDKKWVPYVAYGLATLVGMSRIYHNAHWASDVITGAAVGYGSARAMTAIYRLAGKKIRFLPEVGNRYVSMQVVYSF